MEEQKRVSEQVAEMADLHKEVIAKLGFEVKDYFGGCPECGKSDGYVNVGRSHWFYCKEHRGRCVGENLFSSWRGQSREEQLALAQVLYHPDGNLREGWRIVKPLPTTDADSYANADFYRRAMGKGEKL